MKDDEADGHFFSSNLLFKFEQVYVMMKSENNIHRRICIDEERRKERCLSLFNLHIFD